jgi:hypothetical protein
MNDLKKGKVETSPGHALRTQKIRTQLFIRAYFLFGSQTFYRVANSCLNSLEAYSNKGYH